MTNEKQVQPEQLDAEYSACSSGALKLLDDEKDSWDLWSSSARSWFLLNADKMVLDQNQNQDIHICQFYGITSLMRRKGSNV